MAAADRKLVCLCGPTASGKTALAVKIATKLNTEILSADSRQLFRELSIGTAKPTTDEMKGVKHHFIDHLSVAEDFNSSAFEQQGLEIIEKLFAEKKIPLLCGGSGLYIDALLKGFHPVPDSKAGIRERLLKEFEKKGLDGLLDKLKYEDPDYYQLVDRNNSRRVIRALEVIYSTGRPYSSFHRQHLPERDFVSLRIALELSKEELYDRINRRCDQMMEAGLLEEVKKNRPYRDKVALKTIGYRELFDYIDGNISLEGAIDKFKQHSRNYAKRQITWFKRDPDILWIHPSKEEEIFEAIEKFIS